MHCFKTLTSLALVSALAACGNTDDPPSNGGGAAGGAADNCKGQADEFVVGLEKTGTNHLFKVRLDSAVPAPPAQNLNRWQVTVRTPEGAPVTGATVFTSVFMPPPHNHSVPGQATGVEKSAGVYDIPDINFSTMKDLFEVTVTVATPSQQDAAKFYFCVR